MLPAPGLFSAIPGVFIHLRVNHLAFCRIPSGKTMPENTRKYMSQENAALSIIPETIKVKAPYHHNPEIQI